MNTYSKINQATIFYFLFSTIKFKASYNLRRNNQINNSKNSNLQEIRTSRIFTLPITWIYFVKKNKLLLRYQGKLRKFPSYLNLHLSFMKTYILLILPSQLRLSIKEKSSQHYRQHFHNYALITYTPKFELKIIKVTASEDNNGSLALLNNCLN